MPEIVDGYTHVLTERFFEDLTDKFGFQGLSGRPEFLWDIEGRKEDMADYGVDKQVITLALPTMFQGMDHDLALDITRLANDEIRRLADEHPDQFIPVGTLPFLTGPYLDEYDRCIDDLAMPGVQIFTNVSGRPLDDPDFRPFFERVDASGRPLWLHPQLIESYDWIDDYIDHKMLGWPFDTTLAASRPIFGGVLDDCPDLRVVLHHAGGMLPMVDERIESFAQTRTEDEMYVEDTGSTDRPIPEYFEQFYADTAVSPRRRDHAVRAGLALFGPERTLFGADYPFGPDEGRYWLEHTVEVLDGMDLEAGTREAVYAGNVERLIGE
jgi:aminocarboxymuconate-semialdehyde decarboxylase